MPARCPNNTLRLMAVRLLAVLCAVALAALCAGAADEGAAHPQDGPHAELRLTVTDEGLRLGVGLNLAFIDQVVPIVRESQSSVVGAEREALNQGVLDWLKREVVVEIDGMQIVPSFEGTSLFADPDPAMSAIYPTYGPRALIRVVTTMVLEAPSPQSLSVTWPAYPKDTLNAAMEGLAVEEAPTLFLEAQFRAGGAPIRIIRFSEAEPTFSWSASEEEDSAFVLPAPPMASAPGQRSTLGPMRLVSIGLAFFGVALAPIKKLRVLGVVCVLTGVVGALALGGGANEQQPAAMEVTEAERVFGLLHERMYRAFDYTAESEIYDVLAEAVAGPLLEETYTELYSMLLQAEEEGLVGVVTGVEPIETTITLDLAHPPAFDVRAKWRVEGTVYHWGHTHTRTHEYEAAYRVAPVDGAWKIVSRRILSQFRLGAPGEFPGEL